MMQPTSLTFKYTNYKGETAIRRALPMHIVFTANEFHPEKQWLMTALDLDKNAVRTFALVDCDFTTTTLVPQNLRDAAAEAFAYNRNGGVTPEMLEDIAHDHGVTVQALREFMEWD